MVPQANVNITANSSNTISGEVLFNDPDNIAIFKDVQLYQSGALVSTSTNINFVFNVNSYTDYEVKVNYTYDLNEGNAVVSTSNNISVTSVKQMPTISLSLLHVTDNTVRFNINKNDINNAGNVSAIYLYSGDSYQEVSVNDLSVTNLTKNTSYKLVVIYSYDLLDDKGSQEIEASVEFKTTKVKPTINLASATTINSIKINPEIIDIDNTGSLIKIELYKNGEFIEEQTSNFLFEGLLSNNQYEAKAYYEYDINDGTKEMIVTKTIITDAVLVPGVNINTNSSKTGIEYNVVLETGATFKNIDLLKDGIVVNTSTTITGIFEGLLSNNQYEVKVYYTYDLLDGYGQRTGSVSKTTLTKSLAKPTVNVNITSNTSTQIIGNVNLVSDPDNIYKFINVNVYKNDTNVYTTDLSNISFEVTSNTEYVIVVNYSYDLNDGNGFIEDEYVLNITSSKKTPIVTGLISNITENAAKLTVNETDVDDAGRIVNMMLYQNDVLVRELSSLDITDLISNTEYKVVINYAYDLGTGLKEQTTQVELEFITLKAIPTVSLDAVTTVDSIKVVPNITDVDNTGQLVKIELYKNGVLQDSKTSDFLFEGLLSNNSYEVKCYYSYNINSGDKELIVTNTFKTNEKAAPNVGLSLSSDKRSIKYNVESESGVALKSVELYKNGVKLNNVSNDNTFSNLLSNTVYEVKVTYTYDLNDGYGIRTATISDSIITKSLVVPTVGINVISNTSSKITGMVITSDTDNIYKLVEVKLYLNNSLISQTNTETFSFDVLSNTTYEIVVAYTYDLNDGNGVHEESSSTTITTSKITPTVDLNVYNIEKYRIDYDLYIIDIESTGSLKSIRLYQGDTFLKSLNQYDTYIDGLEKNTEYTLKVYYGYNLNNGTGDLEIQEAVTFKTLKEDAYYYNDLSSGKDYIEINHNLTDYDRVYTLKYVKVYHENTDELIQTFNSFVDNKVEGLLSNNQYRVEVCFAKNLNNGETEVVYKNYVSTQSKSTPYASITASSTKTTVTYDYSVQDYDNVLKSARVELYQNGTMVEITAIDNTFEGLLSNNEYEVRVYLTYDLNDGIGEQETYYSQVINTIELVEGSIDLEFEATIDTLAVNFDIEDIDNTLTVSNAEIYYAGELFDTITDLSSVLFINLPSNSIYTVRVNYSINLNDGNGNTNKYYEEDYSTLAHEIKILSHTILNENAVKTDEDISIRFDLENISQVEIESITITGIDYKIAGGDGINYIIAAINSGPRGGNVLLDIQKINYLLNGFNIRQDVEYSDVSIRVMSRLDILGISTIDGSSQYKIFSPYNGFVLEIDNSEGYEVLSIETNAMGETLIYHIDDNHLFMPRMTSSDSYSDTIRSIKYINENGEQAIRKYEQRITLDAKGFNANSDTGALEIRYISTPEDFMNISSGEVYELTCDIDMTGYNWNHQKTFNGSIDGKGYSIKNLTCIYEDEIYRPQEGVGIFAQFNGTLKNVYFENIYFNINHSEYQEYLDLNFATTMENVLFSGSFIFETNNPSSSYDEYYVLPSGNNYIVDALYVNYRPVVWENIVSKETFDTTEFKEEVLNWKFQEREFKEYEGLQYYIIDNSYIYIFGYEGTSDTVFIPDDINGLPVVAIGDLAFKDCKIIKTIRLPENLLYLGGSILKGCSNLENIENLNLCNYLAITDEATESYLSILFGKVEFENSYAQTDVMYQTVGYIPNSLERVTLSGNYKKIGSCTFLACNSLTSIEIAEGVTSIFASAFGGCYNLMSIVLPKSIESIRESAFSGLLQLREGNVYYGGNASEFAELGYIPGVSEATIHYYSECIHEDGLGLWNYVDGKVSTENTINIVFDADDNSIIASCSRCGLSESSILLKELSGHYVGKAEGQESLSIYLDNNGKGYLYLDTRMEFVYTIDGINISFEGIDIFNTARINEDLTMTILDNNGVEYQFKKYEESITYYNYYYNSILDDVSFDIQTGTYTFSMYYSGLDYEYVIIYVDGEPLSIKDVEQSGYIILDDNFDGENADYAGRMYFYQSEPYKLYYRSNLTIQYDPVKNLLIVSQI